MLSISHQILTIDPNSSPAKVRYGVSFVTFKSDYCQAPLIIFFLNNLFEDSLIVKRHFLQIH